MADDFKNDEGILLQPGSLKNTYKFQFSPAASETSKGAIPYNTNISSVAVSGYTEYNVSANEMVETSSVSDNTVTVVLNYPIVNGEGRYKINFLLTLDDESVWEKDYNRINARNL